MNCNWETRDLLLPTKNPSKMPCFLALNKRLVKTSTTMIKRKGESLSPCLNPLEALTRYLAQPFSQRTKFTEDQQPLIQCLNLEFSLFFLKHGMKNPDKHDRRKYFFFFEEVFFKSTLKTMPSSPEYLFSPITSFAAKTDLISFRKISLRNMDSFM